MIRPATPADAVSIAQVHVTAWRQSYAGLLPDMMIAAHTVASRTALWRQVLSAPTAAGSCAVMVAEDTGGIVGFGACGAQRTAELRQRGYGAEISALYVLAEAHGRGVGTALMAALARALHRQGHDAVSLWVLRTNTRARRFYERRGGEVIGETGDGSPHPEVAYGWGDLAALARSGAAPSADQAGA